MATLRARLSRPEGVVQIFDCVEFNREVRCADVASDLAFLLMDLTLGRRRAAALLVAIARPAWTCQTSCCASQRAPGAGAGQGRWPRTCGFRAGGVARHMAEATDYLDLASAAASLCGQSSWS